MKQLKMRAPRSLGKKKQRGASLVEIGLYFILTLVVFAIAFQLYASTNRDQQSDQAQKTVLALVTGAKSLSQGGRYAGLTTQVMIDSGKVPEGMADGTTIANPFGGQFQVVAASVGGGSNNAVAVCATNVGRSECNSLVSGSAGAFGRIGVGTGAVTCSGTAGTSVKDRWAATPVVPTTATVTTACNNDSNTIAFVTN